MKTTTETVRDSLLTVAAAQVAQYPQYNAAYFAQFAKVATVKRDVRTKMGLSFAKGDVVLVSTRTEDLTTGFVVAWSVRTRIATSLPAACLQVQS